VGFQGRKEENPKYPRRQNPELETLNKSRGAQKLKAPMANGVKNLSLA